MNKALCQEHPNRWEYRISDMASDLSPVISMLVAWGDKWEAVATPVAQRSIAIHTKPLVALWPSQVSRHNATYVLSVDTTGGVDDPVRQRAAVG